jgi:hypothetical protein
MTTAHIIVTATLQLAANFWPVLALGLAGLVAEVRR